MAPKNKPYEQFGPYILFKKLESDTLGDLWRAGRIDDETLGPTVALRRLTGVHRETMLSSIGTARQVAPLLTGPSFVQDQTIDMVGNVPYVAHDYASGRSLRYIVDRARGGTGAPPHPIPLDQAIVIAEKVALSLATVSELRFAGEKLSHGALLPQFIWISDSGEIRVAGQQLGKGLLGGKTPAEIARYFSPEYQHSREPTKASEVYSVGAILFLIVTGHEPPDGMSTSAFAAAIRGAKTTTGEPIPDDIKPILEKSLNLDPGMRFATVADMQQALTTLANSGKYSATTFNLAFYLSNLLKKEFEGEAVEREKESKVNVGPYVETLLSFDGESPEPVSSDFPGFSAIAPKSKMPVVLASAAALAVLGAGAFFLLGTKQTKTAPPAIRVAATTATPQPRPPVIPEPILSSPAGISTATTTGDAASQKKAFEEAVKQRLRAEMMKLQSEYTQQLQQQQAKNAPVPASAPNPPPTQVAEVQPSRTSEDRSVEPSAAQLDQQRQREAIRQPEPLQQTAAPSTQAPAPVSTSSPQPSLQQTPPTAAAVQIREGDVVDVASLDVMPKLAREVRVAYPPMAARQKIETNVLTSVLISETGEVLDIKVLRGDPRFGFNEAAVRALRSARFSPGVKDGKRVKTWLPQIIQFKPGA